MKKVSIYAKVARFKELLRWFLDKYQPRCYFCNVRISWEDILLNKWTIHHKDHDRSNNKIENLEICHRGCHRSYHRRLEEKKREREIRKILVGDKRVVRIIKQKVRQSKR